MPIPNHIRKITIGTALARPNPCPKPPGWVPPPPPKNIGGPSNANVITNEIGGSIMRVRIMIINIFFVLFNCMIIPSII
jgi:hypothetical protein